jgi:hypothetical protein
MLFSPSAMRLLGTTIVAGLALLQGCIIDTVPIPDDRNASADAKAPGAAAPAIDASALCYSTDPVILVGFEGALPGAGEVRVVNPARQNWTSALRSNADGSFAMPLNAAIGDEVELSFSNASTQPSAIVLRLLPPSDAARQASNEVLSASAGDNPAGVADSTFGAISATSPDADGMTTVSGPAATIASGTGAAVTVIVANATRGLIAKGAVADDGSFSIRLPASSGNELKLFAIATATQNGGTALTLVVP